MKLISKCLLLVGVLTLVTACGKNASTAQNVAGNVIVGPDNRVPLNPRIGAYQKILHLEGGCTASLVGRGLVLTAAHCLKRFLHVVNGRHEFRHFPRVFAGYTAPNNYLDSARVTYARWGSLNFQGQDFDDWALLKLDKHLGDRFGWFGVLGNLPLNSHFNFNLVLAGYSTDRFGLTGHIGCNITNHETNNRLIHNCDLTPGASGAPLFKCQGNTCHIVGVQSGERKGRGQNTAVSVNRFIRWVHHELNN